MFNFENVLLVEREIASKLTVFQFNDTQCSAMKSVFGSAQSHYLLCNITQYGTGVDM
jgi:hypothetical protein